jgi:hypothetical protein
MITNNNPSNATSSLSSILNMTSAPSTGSSTARGVFSSILSGAANMFFPGLGTILGNAIGGSAALGAGTPMLGGQTTQYLQLQQEIESETIAFNLASNVLKVRADSAAKAIDNMKL